MHICIGRIQFYNSYLIDACKMILHLFVLVTKRRLFITLKISHSDIKQKKCKIAKKL